MDWTDGDIAGVVVRSVKKHTDERGWLAEVFRSDELPADAMPVMAYVSATRSGVVRGPHEHKEQADCFGFIYPGKFMLRLWDNRTGSATYGNRLTLTAGGDNPVVVTVPPGVVHAYRNTSDKDSLVLNCPNRLYAGKGKTEPVDEVRYESIDTTDFSMDD